MTSEQKHRKEFVEHARVRLRVPLPEHGLQAGDTGTIVHAYCLGDMEVEFGARGDQKVATLRADVLELIHGKNNGGTGA